MFDWWYVVLSLVDFSSICLSPSIGFIIPLYVGFHTGFLDVGFPSRILVGYLCTSFFIFLIIFVVNYLADFFLFRLEHLLHMFSLHSRLNKQLHFKHPLLLWLFSKCLWKFFVVMYFLHIWHICLNCGFMCPCKCK